ncbi:molybdenum cofactor biosynthesis prote [Dentipellis sp. KUC8613]|nr:molybdenum cofactor biosynthesis prote [Dentipellis sp. KUC8613]
MDLRRTIEFPQGEVKSARTRSRQQTREEHMRIVLTLDARIAQIDDSAPVAPSLVDTFGRHHNYLRISLTERCNLRCFYCMPEDGVPLSPNERILSDDEIIRLATLFVKSGVTKIRLTGGEPTVRKTIVQLVGRLNELRQHGLQSIGMTSNGLILHRHLDKLVANGLTHLNLSLDTLDPFKFEIMTRRMGHEAVLRSLSQALASPGLTSVKLNVVVIKGLNDSEVLKFVEMTRDQDLSIRFIEFMPFTGNKWDKAKMVPSAVLISRIAAVHPGLVKAADELNDTARSYQIPSHRGSIGFISSMSDHFCSSCNRLRLTADGQIKVCLFDAKEVSLRDQMRAGADDQQLLQTIGRAVRGKKEKHAGMEDIDVVTNRPMILIGGIRTRLSSLTRAKLVPWHLIIPASFSLKQIRHSSTSTPSPPKLSHMDDAGRPSMVDVSEKQPTKRTATATGRIYLSRIAYELITPTSSASTSSDVSASPLLEKAKAKARGKGDVLTVAQLAAIMASKRTSDLIPLCHPLGLSHVSVTLTPEEHPDDTQNPKMRGLCHSVLCKATVTCEGRTGVEMEALTAVSVGLLTVWDMLKAVAGKEMVISDIFVAHKAGGKSGDFIREER